MLFEAVLVDDRTSTGHPKQPVLVSVATSTSQLSDQYWSIFPFYNSALLLRRKSLRPLSGSQLSLIHIIPPSCRIKKRGGSIYG